MYAFLLRPKWIASHLLVGALVATMVFMGFWQLNRLDQRQSTNNEVTTRIGQPEVDIGDLTSAAAEYSVGADVRFRLARATGEYRPDDEVLVLNRSLNGAPGYWVLTPLLLDDGTAVVVNRGWIPFRLAPGEPRPETAAAQGLVVVSGLVRETVVAQGIQSSDPADGVLDALARPDLERYQQQLSYEILPVLLQAEATAGAGNSLTADLPVALPRPVLDQGPHFSYATQWFIFSIIGLIGYPLVLRRIARSDGKDGRHSDIPVDYL